MYKLTYRKDVQKSLKKIKKSNSKKFVLQFQEIFKTISKNPKTAGEPYVGNMTGIYKYPFGKCPEYRIMYTFYTMQFVKKNLSEFADIELTDDEIATYEGIVDLLFIRTREDCNNLYKQNRKFFEEKLRKGEEVSNFEEE